MRIFDSLLTRCKCKILGLRSAVGLNPGQYPLHARTIYIYIYVYTHMCFRDLNTLTIDGY